MPFAYNFLHFVDMVISDSNKHTTKTKKRKETKTEMVVTRVHTSKAKISASVYVSLCLAQKKRYMSHIQLKELENVFPLKVLKEKLHLNCLKVDNENNIKKQGTKQEHFITPMADCFILYNH